MTCHPVANMLLQIKNLIIKTTQITASSVASFIWIENLNSVANSHFEHLSVAMQSASVATSVNSTQMWLVESGQVNYTMNNVRIDENRLCKTTELKQ
jgi:hypothetical protein